MFFQKPRNSPSSCSSPSLSSLSDITLRSRIVSRDGLLTFTGNGSATSSSDTSLRITPKKKKNGKKNQPLRKTKKGKGAISKKSELDFEDTMVIAPFHALKESFQKRLKLCCKKIDVESEEDLNKELRSIFKKSKRKPNNRIKCNPSEDNNFCGCFDLSGNASNEPGKRVTDSESSSVILEGVKLSGGRLKNKQKLNSPPVKKINKKTRIRKKTKNTNRRVNTVADRFLHKKNSRNNSNSGMKKKIQKDFTRTYNTRYRTRSKNKENSKKNDLVEINLGTELDHNSIENPNGQGQKIVNAEPSTNLSENREEPPCIVLHPYDPSKRLNEKITSDDFEDDLENSAPKEITEAENSAVNALEASPEGKINEESEVQGEAPNKNLLANDKIDKSDKMETTEDGKKFHVVEPCIIVKEHYNEPSSAEFSASEDDEDQGEIPQINDALQESDIRNYVFGHRNDFSHLRESCEYSFGLATSQINDEKNDFETFH